MKRKLTIILGAMAAAALFGGLVYAVLVAAHLSEPAVTTVYGPTARRLWATTIAVLALAGVIVGTLALARRAGRFGTASGRIGGGVALGAGLIAVINGGLNLAVGNGGPGTVDLEKAGIHFRNVEAGPGGKQIQIEDPDGNPIELFEPARH
jgi:hypothetical protein